MDTLNLGDIVYILLPDFSVCQSIIEEIFEDNVFKIKTDDGRIFFRTSSLIYDDEIKARATKFLCRYKFRLKIGNINNLLDIEDKEIIEYALEKWPEEFI